jgi:hypothetical protein
MTTIAVLQRRTDNPAQRRLRRRPRSRCAVPTAKHPCNRHTQQQSQSSTRAMAACQPRNQPPRRTRRSRAHTFRISQITIAKCAAFSAPHPPRVLSLAAFGRRPLVLVAPLSLAGIRNPTQQQKSLWLCGHVLKVC